MKNAVLLLALVGSLSAHATLTTGEMPAGQTNCSAALDGDTANKKAEATREAKVVFADAKLSPASSAPSHVPSTHR